MSEKTEKKGEMKIGIYGGTFNPIHTGHIRIAEAFLNQEGLDEVWLMVSPQNPFKVGKDLLDDERRLQWVCKSVIGHKGLVACDYEFSLPKPSYTWHTLQQLSNDFPTAQFTLLIGGDNWKSFHFWRNHDEILANYRIVIFPRKGDEIEKNALPNNVRLLKSEMINISSTDIRESIKTGKSIRGMVAENIEEEVKEVYAKGRF